MATIANNSYQATEHQINTGKTILPAKWQWALDNSSHVAGDALSAIEVISGATRVNGFTSRAVTLRLAYSVASGTPAPKECRLYLISKQSIPATAPVVSAAQVWIASDAAYVLGTVDIATADWLVSDKIATVNKTFTIDCINEDATVGTTVYAFLLNTVTTWTPPSGSLIEATLWFEMN